MVYLPTITEQKSAGRVQRAGRGAGGVAVVYVQRLTHAWRHGASLHPVHCSAPVDASLSLQHWAPRRSRRLFNHTSRYLSVCSEIIYNPTSGHLLLLFWWDCKRRETNPAAEERDRGGGAGFGRHHHHGERRDGETRQRPAAVGQREDHEPQPHDPHQRVVVALLQSATVRTQNVPRGRGRDLLQGTEHRR